MKVDGALKSLLQGVSQQPIRERLAGQCTEQINFTADPVTGLTRRPPTDLVAHLDGAIDPNLDGLTHMSFKTRTGEGFFAQVGRGAVNVWDLNGNPRAVNVEAPATFGYVDGAGSSYAHAIIGNDIYIANRSVDVLMSAGSKQYANAGPGAVFTSSVIQVLGGAFAREYQIFLNGVRAAYYLSPDGGAADQGLHIRASRVAQYLREALTTVVDRGVTGGGGRVIGTGMMASAPWGVDIIGDTLRITNTASQAFSITTSDDTGGTILKSITDVAADIDSLPRYASNGHVTRIAQNADSNFDLWMVFETEVPVGIGQGFGQEGFWKETVAPGVAININPARMPHVLEYDVGSGNFIFKRMDIRERRTGNDISNPEPSFIGNTINDISLFQSRLVLTSGNYLVMSRTNRLGDFWISSLSDILDTDPIDIGSNAQEAASLEWIVPHNKDLVIFTPSAQFVLPGRTGITPGNASLALTTVFESDIGTKPESCGKNVFFPNTFGRFSGIREFFTEISGEVNDTRAITTHVKNYIVGRTTQLAASSNYDMLLCRASSNARDVFVYQFIWADNDKIQSAWHKYTYQYDLTHVFWDQAVVYLISTIGGELYMSRMYLDVEDSFGVGYPVYLDYRYDVFDVHTQFVMPEGWLAENMQTVVQGPACPNPGMTVPIESVEEVPGTGQVVTLKYDMLGGDIIVGTPYRSSFIPTPPMIKDEAGVAIGSAKLKLKNYRAAMANTGYIAGRKITRYGEYPIVESTGRYVGFIDNIIGEQIISDFEFSVPVRELSTEAEVEFFTDKPFPATILDIEWYGQYWKSGRRIDTGD